MVIEWVVVAPEGPAVGEARSPAQSPPDRQPVQRAQDDDQGARDPFPGSRRRTLRSPSRRSGELHRAGDRSRVLGHPVRRGGSGRGQPRTFNHPVVSRSCALPPASIAARRIRTCNQGIQGPSRFHEAWTISSSSSQHAATDSRSLAVENDGRSGEEAGRSRRGLLLGLTPLVSEPSWPPEPGQARLRIAVPEAPSP